MFRNIFENKILDDNYMINSKLYNHNSKYYNSYDFKLIEFCIKQITKY